MREMKDSGIAWIGEIPKDWSVIPLKYLLSNEIDSLRVGPFGSELKSTDFTDEGYWVYNQRTVLDYNFTTNDTYISEEKYRTMAGFQIRPKDILITTRGTIGRICRISDKFYKGVIHPCIIKFRINEDVVLYPYLELIFNSSSLFLTQLTYQSNATTIEVIYGGTLKNLMVPIPTDINLQKRISKYLMRRCNEIDNIIKDIQRQIEVLQEYKQSVITEAVTKGLDKDVAMKDSGIDWIGNIPHHWTVKKVKYLGDSRNGLTYKPIDIVDENEGTLVLRSSNIQDGKLVFDDNVYVSSRIPKNLKVKKGDILICSRNGSRELIGKNTLIDDVDATFGAFMMIYRCIAPRFIYYVLNSEVFKYYLGTFFTSTINQLTGSNFNNMKIVFCPDEEERQKITNYLDEKCSKIDVIIADKQKQLDTLIEYKKSLIYEYVTGKKEVPMDA
ncbi:type I restriction enzyme, S subunit [Selenomonas ruminantium]|uniref:Type I restriction enzyme, S subunit n=1 Tax=Selenomonas ruminantium TaxID=971 RepID=A0A1M6WMA2_SELRU|nr:restriction endonuclease subunit S [Selenomonas ruminantium]SHK94655.1 type I restriction enzyme, S subunit [Selenomonas ruminantium]